MVKHSQKEADYTDHGTYKEHCSKCEHYSGKHTCKVIRGNVSPGGWCKYFEKAT